MSDICQCMYTKHGQSSHSAKYLRMENTPGNCEQTLLPSGAEPADRSAARQLNECADTSITSIYTVIF